jgi:hypothetical protein
MFKVKLENEIKKLGESNIEETNSVLNEAQKLLEMDSAEDRQILRSMGIDKSIKVIEEKKSNSAILKNHIEQYKNPVLTKDQIKDIAIKYHLRFLRSDKYSGYIESTLPAIIKNFGKENNINLGSYDYQYKFYILAPAKSFKLQDKPKPVDPILFYSINDDQYLLVHKWGNDLNVWNLIQGWFMRDPFSFIFMCILTSLVFSIGLNIATNHNHWGTATSIILITAFSSFWRAIWLDDKDKFSIKNWESEYK